MGQAVDDQGLFVCPSGPLRHFCLVLFGTNSLLMTRQTSQNHKRCLFFQGEFRVERRHSKTPMYSKKRMPESVTIYENDFEPFLSHDASIIDGKVLLYRSDGELDVMVW